MAAWLPVLKAAIPYVAQIVTAAIPAFTSKPTASITDPLISKQIEELQSAATHNAESIHVLAEKLQLTIQGIDEAAMSLQKQVVLFKRLLITSNLIATIALLSAIWAIFH